MIATVQNLFADKETSNIWLIIEKPQVRVFTLHKVDSNIRKF